MLLHLGDGSGEVLEIVHETVSQNPSGGRAYLSLGAGSVVTKDIPANVVAAGNPCRVIRQIETK